MVGYLFGMFPPDGIQPGIFGKYWLVIDYSIGKLIFHLYTDTHITQIATYQQIGIHFHFYLFVLMTVYSSYGRSTMHSAGITERCNITLYYSISLFCLPTHQNSILQNLS